jgi:hypothetical protein
LDLDVFEQPARKVAGKEFGDPLSPVFAEGHGVFLE